ncbi:hypothetical protein [Halomonas maura]|uniref:hypothetical protein n=1 Tax=Halomonas maura TaxID=117606 RepID=UPI0025B3E29B|nr:hypothetical protein [Halomonas maura]MDN3556947.1 hypothetical protein [Halomonas maura]
MNTKLTLSALLIAALPLAAQADNAAERALQLNQAPLAPLSQNARPVHQKIETVEFDGDSAAMQQARANLKARPIETRFAATADGLAPARDATS